jgi:hypothetical protein
MTSPDDLALILAQRGHGRFTFEDASLVIDELNSLGYTFVPPGTPGRFAESDETMHAMRMYLAKATGVHRETVKEILVAADLFGVRPREPDQHPSGLRTTAAAYETVRQFGKGRNNVAREYIDMRMPGMGKRHA